MQPPDAQHLRELQAYIAELERKMGWEGVDLAHTALQFAEESGELVRVVNRLERGPSEARRTELRHEGARELVDCLNYLLALANRLGVDLGDAFAEVNTQNQSRSWEP